MTNRTHVLLAAALLVSGCAHEAPPLPTYPLTDNDVTIRRLAEQSHAIRSVSGEGLLTLTRPDGQSIRLDAAVVMQPPAKVRLRAWKFGQAVFDLTMNDAGVYLITPKDSSHKEQIQSAGVSSAKLARTWSLLSGAFFDAPGAASASGDRLEVRRAIDGQTVMCEVDRPTLTVRKYTLLDDTSRSRFTLGLDRYAVTNGVPWPRRMMAVSDAGRIVVDLKDVELNGEINPDAFTPPRRAEKLP